ncbi:hypothetical protein [Microbacterium sp. YY-01]|uniref:hypothetical protein n=1 Tax=Microbacterium sp. YY-01 TaxID=3421634 RepID=UPI003D16DBC6
MWRGKVGTKHVIYLSEHLCRNPYSRVFALRGGSPQLMGWDQHTVIAARTHNLIASLVSSLSGKHDPELFIDYPGGEKKEQTVEVIAPATIAEFSVSGFNNLIYGGA